MKNSNKELKKYALSCFLLFFALVGWGQMDQSNLQITRDQQSVPIFIKGKQNQLITPISSAKNKSNKPMDIATPFLVENKELLQLSNPAEEFKEKELIVDKQGNKHIKLQQYWNNIPIWNSQAIVHANAQGVYSFSGTYHASPELSVETATISQKSAMKIVKSFLGKEKFILTNAIKSILPDRDENLPELVYYHDKLSNAFELAWKVKFHTTDHENWLFMIDAQDGKILKKVNQVCHLNKPPTTARAIDLHGKEVNINTFLGGSEYFLVDVTKPMFNPNSGTGIIRTLDAQFSDSFNTRNDLISSTDNRWTDPTAVSAHYHAGICYDYFYDTFGRDSYDGKGGDFYIVINGNEPDNATWFDNFMVFGYGDSVFKEGSTAKSLDIAAHELTHGVVNTSANFEKTFEPGALDESFADIFGVMVDRDDWTLGEDIANLSVLRGGALRNLANPSNGGRRLGDGGWQPSHMRDYQVLNADVDRGGIHINSGIPNHAFYLFATTSGIGKNKAEQVYYKALTEGLMPSSKFIHCRLEVIAAAQALYGTSAANAAAAAFDKVGIFGDSPVNSKNVVALKNIRIDATYEHISVLAKISGDENLDSKLFIEYRPQGSSTYTKGAQTLRAHPEMVVAGRTLNRNHHAGSALFLKPNTSYQLRIVLVDADGGSALKTITVKTKADMPTNNGTSYYVVPGSGGGTGSSSNPFRGLQAAANKARAGSTFIVKNGVYKPFTINKSGTKNRPIIFKSQNRNGAVIDGRNTDRGIVNIGNFDGMTEHIMIDGFSIKNGAWGINAENTAYLTVRNNKIENVDYGFNNRREKGLEHDQTIENNVFTGRRNSWPRSGMRPGIDIRGNNNVVRFNTIQYFGDGISTDGRAYEISYGMDIHDNEVAHCVADAIEVDYTVANNRIYRNRCSDSKVGISMRPLYGGPCYVFDNSLLNQQAGYIEYKTNEGDSGVIFGNNSFSSTPSTETSLMGGNSIASDEETEQLSSQLEPLQLEVMPNPIQQNASIRFYLPTATSAASSLSIFNTTGQLIKEQVIESTQGWQNTQLDASELTAGMYYIILQTSESSLVEKVIVK